nr:MAG TPA: hypothetical protein [Bacteriophage sp.]
MPFLHIQLNYLIYSLEFQLLLPCVFTFKNSLNISFS